MTVEILIAYSDGQFNSCNQIEYPLKNRFLFSRIISGQTCHGFKTRQVSASEGAKLMKKTAACLAFISSVLLFTATLVPAAEQKIVFTTESIEYKSGTGPKRCQDICNKKSGPDATALLSEGWKIVNSSHKKVVGEQYRYAPCPTCEPHGCICIGTEYLLQKDLVAPKIVTSNSDLDQLKDEKDLLKEEIFLLKQEIENLKNQLKTNQIAQ